MKRLDHLYSRFLSLGFIVLREAIEANDPEWIKMELEVLHNVPSLIGESNLHRHVYFWQGERTLYIERTFAHNNNSQKSAMRAYYEPIWDEMEPIMKEMKYLMDMEMSQAQIISRIELQTLNFLKNDPRANQ